MKKKRIEMQDADVVLFPALFSAAQSDILFELLAREIAWKQEKVHMFGRTMDIPRLTAWYGDEGVEYSYSGILHRATGWSVDLLEIKARVERVARTLLSSTTFNSVLLNRYRDGSDSVSWHSDDERALGIHPVIASVSFGQPRRFQFKHKHDSKLRGALELPHGSLLLMRGATQHYWLHQVPKSRQRMGERINLTYRVIHPRGPENRKP